MVLKEKQEEYRQKLEEKRAEFKQAVEGKRIDAAAELKEKREQYKIALELKRKEGDATIDIELFNKTVAEIQANISELDSASIACVFSKPS